MGQQRYKVIACAVLARECYHCAALSPNIIDLQLIRQGLHDVGEAKMSPALQEQIDAVDQEQYDAILLGYGLCNNGIRNLHASIPIVVSRAHDCITLLLGSKEYYSNYFNDHPGTYYSSTGWNERVENNLSNPDSTTRQMGMTSYEEYVEKYGEDNAKYLWDVLGDHLRNYSDLTYIDVQIPGSRMSEQSSRDLADEQKWTYSEAPGNVRLLRMLMDGDWDESEFLVVQPGKTIDASHDDGIVVAKQAPENVSVTTD